ncbi:MAG: 50S ribosomal protein L11 methyltransferase, partial [Bacteroidales bacterium]|nr:50S ribosomal protein L11 methyltransferase [Bacteroidales bacterium]
WAFNNAMENVQRNGVEMTIGIGDASLLTDRHDTFDLIIANINRNILLNDMSAYVAALHHSGTLLLSGFYESDIPTLQQHAESLGLHLHQTKTRQGWAAVLLK